MQALTPTDFARRVQKLLPRVTASNLVDLLHMTTSYAVQGRATTAATLLLNHDRDHLHVLHLKPARTSHHNNPAPHVPAHSASESNEEQQYQQQVAAAKCIAQVMQTCIAINNEAILNILLALPAAQFIGEAVHCAVGLQRQTIWRLVVPPECLACTCSQARSIADSSGGVKSLAKVVLKCLLPFCVCSDSSQ